MYRMNQPFMVHLELTDNCNARCPQCARNSTQGELGTKANVGKRELDLAAIQRIFDPFPGKIGKVLFCGNYGDPIAAKDIGPIGRYFAARKALVLMNTNGSFKSPEWWANFAGELKDTRHKITFAIDGLEDTHARYRVNTDFNRIMENASAFIGAGGNAVWSMLIFKHNEHQVEACRARSKQMGFIGFESVFSNRFGKAGEMTYQWKGQSYTLAAASAYHETVKERVESKERGDAVEIRCKASRKNEFYLDCTGNVHACCWLGNQFYAHWNFNRQLEEHPTYHRYERTENNAFERPLLDILTGAYLSNTLPGTFNKHPCEKCRSICGHNIRKRRVPDKIHLIGQALARPASTLRRVLGVGR